MSKQIWKFDERLLQCINDRRNDEAKSMLSKELVQAIDKDRNTLLHHVARCNNDVIAREVIALGADVDSLGENGWTPLLLAVWYDCADTVKVLLEAEASIDIVSGCGSNGLNMGFAREYYDPLIVGLLTERLYREKLTSEELTDKMINAGCKMCQAVVLGDVGVMECMMRRGMSIDGVDKGDDALHVAAQLNKLNVVEWLLNLGRDPNVCNPRWQTPLMKAAPFGNKDVIKLLLERGADSNHIDEYDYTPLYLVFYKEVDGDHSECAELLLQYGAVPRNSTLERWTMFDLAAKRSMDETANVIICHLAMLEMLGTSITKSVMYCAEEKYRSKQSEFEHFHELCLQVLKTKFFEELSLFNLLQAKDHKMRLLCRNETFSLKIKEICIEHKLKELYTYYYNKLMKLIVEASRVVELEDRAYPAICSMFQSDYERCYMLAKGVIGYLKAADLERLVEV